jgi:hypothetical protein
MAWMLQPHNYTQVIRPNLYNVAYRRVGAYKGMGGLGQTPPPPQYTYCSDVSCANYGPTQPGDNVVPYLAPQNIPQLPLGYGVTPGTTFNLPSVAGTGQTLGQWMQANSGLLSVAAVIVVVLAASRR